MIIVDASRVAGQPARLHGIVRQPETRMLDMKALPFAPLVPNDDTIEAMREARRGDLPQFANVEDLFNDLRADDRAAGDQ
ncbi:type II toxin-antitoxin system antitoxin, RelB/DinJ family [Candidatus Palauibacter sp.]|uniref:type II toxin-antitoxin system antitoxin, RelB/DinJ family n=1 Tax=Candidatus Palauibacter sp. TaxID=3101350 RepID=UPI003B018B46